MFAEDISAFFATTDFAVAASRTPAAGGSAQTGALLFDEPGTLLEDAGVVTNEPMVEFPASQWPAVATGDTITIDASALPSHLSQLAGSYAVRQVLRVDDGATKRVVLARA